ncbi:amidohydrolase family protein [Mesorhizobium australicum]
MTIVDAHHHIWRQADLPWLNGPMIPRIFGAYEPLRRDYTIDEYRADAASAGVTASVYVQTNWAPADASEEVAWVQETADRFGWPHGIVGFADLASDDLDAVLAAHKRSPLLRGIRQQLHWHHNEQYRFVPNPAQFLEPKWRDGLAKLGPLELLFELQIFAGQMKDAARMIALFPETTFVLEHAGMAEDQTAAGKVAWRQGMELLAARPNVNVKLSGLGTFRRRARIDDMRPLILDTIEMFGADRTVWGSNFPIEKLWTSYGELLAIAKEVIAPLPSQERRKILGETAIRLYRLDV